MCDMNQFSFVLRILTLNRDMTTANLSAIEPLNATVK